MGEETEESELGNEVETDGDGGDGGVDGEKEGRSVESQEAWQGGRRGQGMELARMSSLRQSKSRPRFLPQRRT